MATPLPEPGPRQELHTRKVVCQGFHRADGHFDIDANLLDTRSFELPDPASEAVPAGAPIHDMWLRLTLDESLQIVAVAAHMAHAPFDVCPDALPAFDALVGERIGKGWRGIVQQKVGGVQGCTHLKEMLLAMATVAYQTIGAWRRRRDDGSVRRQDVTERPHFVDGCRTWSASGPLVARIYPQFAVPKPGAAGAPKA